MNITSLNMGSQIAGLPTITPKKKLFGLMTSYVYTPTNSGLQGRTLNCNSELASSIKQLVEEGNATKLPTKIESSSDGNHLIEYAYSEDGMFFAIQFLEYANFEYQATSKPFILEGDFAKQMTNILK